MSCVWICLNLLCAATYFLQSSASLEGVLVWCPETVEVEAGHLLTINCSLHYPIDHHNCTITDVKLNRNNVTKDIPKVEHPKYVLLNVSNVTKSNNWTFQVFTDCGLAESNTIEVKIPNPPDLLETRQNQHPESHSKVPSILGVCVPVTIVIFVLLLFGIIFLKHIKRKKVQGAYTLQDSSSSPDQADI